MTTVKVTGVSLVLVPGLQQFKLVQLQALLSHGEADGARLQLSPWAADINSSCTQQTLQIA